MVIYKWCTLDHMLRIRKSHLVYCIPGNFSDVKTLANLVINSFSLELQVANLVLCCSTVVKVSKFAR